MDELEVFETRVRERAFHMWQEAGCPENTADEYWHRARAAEMDQLNLTPQRMEQVEKNAEIPEAADFA